jgi:hypothetical protein
LFTVFQVKKGIEKMEATAVPGRKTIVTTARLFMASESTFAAMPRAVDSFASSNVRSVSSLAIRWKSYGASLSAATTR